MPDKSGLLPSVASAVIRSVLSIIIQRHRERSAGGSFAVIRGFLSDAKVFNCFPCLRRCFGRQACKSVQSVAKNIKLILPRLLD